MDYFSISLIIIFILICITFIKFRKPFNNWLKEYSKIIEALGIIAGIFLVLFTVYQTYLTKMAYEEAKKQYIHEMNLEDKRREDSKIALVREIEARIKNIIDFMSDIKTRQTNIRFDIYNAIQTELNGNAASPQYRSKDLPVLIDELHYYYPDSDLHYAYENTKIFQEYWNKIQGEYQQDLDMGIYHTKNFDKLIQLTTALESTHIIIAGLQINPSN